jgi:hypothetical protein
VVESLDYVLSPDVVDITSHLLEVGVPDGEILTLLGMVDYHDLVARVLFAPMMAYDGESNDGPPNSDFNSVAPSPYEAPVSNKEKSKYGADNDGLSKFQDTRDMQQRSVSLGSLPVTVPMSADVGTGFSKSTGGLRCRPRRSVFGVFKFKHEEF